MIDTARLVEQVARAICNADEIPDWRCGQECRLTIDGMAPCDHAAGAKAAVALVLRIVADDLDYMANGGSLETDAIAAYRGRCSAYRKLAAEVEGGK